MDYDQPLNERLPYPTQPMYFPDGTCVEEFIIPEEDKEIVLEQLYPFSPTPKLTDVMYDMHADKTFIVKDFRVTWEYGMNYLVSPYYPESGGTVMDWIEDGSEEFDESDDLDDVEGLDDDLPDGSAY